MKKLRLFLLTLVALVGGGSSVLADPYTVDFNTTITTSSHDFAVASNWSHIVDYLEYDYYGPEYAYVSYGYNSTEGKGGTGALYAYSQYLTASYTSDSKDANDLLVTPLISGTVTIDVKAMNYSDASLQIYAIDNGVKGDLIKSVVKSDLSTEDYTTISFELTSEQKVGLRLNRVYIDNFTATSATILPEPKLTVTAVTKATDENTVYFKQQADGSVKIQMYVTLQNQGEVDFVAGTTENYTLSVIQDYYGTKFGPFGAFAIPFDLAKGATSDPILVEISVPAESYSTLRTWGNWYVIENVTSTQSSGYVYAGLTAYESKFVFRESGSTNTSSLSSAQNWGTITESTSKNFEVANLGTAPLTFYLNNCTAPTGFTLTPGFNPLSPTTWPEGMTINSSDMSVTLNSGTIVPFTVTQNASATGTYSGTLTITYKDYGAENNTNYTLDFSATVIGANTWTADFNNSTSTVVYPIGSIAEGGINKDYQYISSGKYNNWLIGRNGGGYDTGNNKFITPKLHANANDKLAFDVKAGFSSTDEYFVKVYVSADRLNWGDPVETYVYSTVGNSFTTKTISFDTAGDYYVAFAIYGTGSGIDNLVGLEKVDVTHDLYIKSVEWPHEAGKSVKSGTALSKPSVDIIPLTDEAAANYTVKYIYGDNEVAIASKALTASASSTTSFAASFTPTVETTTTFPGTKVVFEFTDGTKFETETFDLTVTNEPIFHFLGSKHTSRWYEPTSDYTTPVNFGKTNTSGTSKTFYVLNWGSAPLTVKSIAVPNGFTTSAESMNIPAFDGTQDGLETCQQSFDVTFSATEAGTYSGNLVVTYVNGAGEDATFELAVSGTMLDPTLWYANFNDQAWPAGSVYQDNVSVAYINTGDYGLLSSSSTKNLFITPKLTAAAGDVLQFDASTRNSYYDGTVKIYVATDRENLGDAVKEIELSKTDNVSKSTYEYTFDTAGDYYVAFALSEARVDDIYGLKLAEVDHDWMIASSNIPAEGMQNYTSTATVNILNLGIKDEVAEDITVTAYVNGEAVATAEGVAIPMSHKLSDAGTQLSISYMVNETGTFPVYLEVKAGDYSVATEPVNVVFAAEEAKTEADMAVNGTTGDVPLNLNYHNSESVTMYNADALAAAGISAGTKIKKITYKGYKTTDVQTTSFQVYYKWTDDQTLAQPANTYPYAAADNGMTKLIDEDHTWAKVGSSSELGEMIVLDFTESPLTYEEGKSLVIYMHSYVNSYKAAYFEKSTISNDYCYERQQDYTSISNSWNKKNPAALHFTLETSVATFAGSVKTIDGDPIADADVTLAADNGVKYSGKTGNDGAYSINVIQTGLSYNVTATNGEVSATGRNVSFADGNVTKNFVLGTISLGDVPKPAIYAEVVLHRTLKKGWNAVVLPFAVSAEELADVCGADEGIELAEYDYDEGDTEVIVKFKDVDAVEANVPFLLYLPSEDRENPEFTNVDLAADEAVTKGNVFDFVGVYDRTDVYAGDYFIQGGKFVKASTENYVLPYRSYLKLKDTSAVARSIRFVIGDNQVVTAINGLTIDATSTEGAYNLQGQKVEQLKKGGLYIINGKKVMVK